MVILIPVILENNELYDRWESIVNLFTLSNVQQFPL